MRFQEYGRPDGAPVIFFLGTPQADECVTEVVDLATEAGIRLIWAVRPWYADRTIQPSFESCTEQVIRYLRQHEIDHAFAFGGSGGGPFALHLASNHPDTFGACYLLASMGDPDAMKRAVVSPHTQVLLELLANDDYDHAIATMSQWGIPPDLAHGAWADFKVLFGSWASINLASPVPVYIHHAVEDDNAPLESVQVLASRLANSTLRISPHASHLSLATDRAFPEIRAVFSEIAERYSTAGVQVCAN